MNKGEIITFYDYNYWANARVLAAAAKVTPEQLGAPAGLSQGSLRGALAHILAAEVVWRLRCQAGVSLPALPSEAEFPDMETLCARWREEEGAMRAYLAALAEAFQSLEADGAPVAPPVPASLMSR